MNLFKMTLWAAALGLMSVPATAAVDMQKSEFKWSASKVVAGGHVGTIKLKKANFNGQKGTFVADMNSIDVTDLDGELKQKFLGHIKSDDFFKVDKYPTVTVKVDKIANGKLTGTMTLLGKSGAISMPVSEKNGVYTGQLVFDRTKWGLKYGSDSFFKGLGDKAISDTVKLDVKLVTK